MYVIDKTVPMPILAKRGPGRTPLYPFALMEIGDSFEAIGGNAEKARYAVVKWKARFPGWQYTAQKTPNGLRIWRTA